MHLCLGYLHYLEQVFPVGRFCGSRRVLLTAKLAQVPPELHGAQLSPKNGKTPLPERGLIFLARTCIEVLERLAHLRYFDVRRWSTLGLGRSLGSLPL